MGYDKLCKEHGSIIDAITLRELTISDYEEMLPLCKALDEMHVQARPDYFISREDVYPKEHYEAAICDPECLLLGAFSAEGQLIGYVRATLWKESGMVKMLKTVCLDNIYVVPSFRRGGVASRLFNAVEQWAREQGAVRLELHTWEFNQSAIAMYRSKDMIPQRYVFEKKL